MDATALSPMVGPSHRPADRRPRSGPSGPLPGPIGSRSGASAPLLPSEPAFLAWIAGRLSDSEATLWTGSVAGLSPLLEILYAGVAVVGGRVSLVEGANRFDPYRIGEAARSLGVDPMEAVGRIRLARAFTAHQLVALVDRWSSELAHHPATLLVAHDLPALFYEDDIALDEREALLARVASLLARTVERARRPLLLVQPGGLARFPGLVEHGPRLCDYLMLGTQAGERRLCALRDGARHTLVARPAGQHGLEEYGGSSEVMTRWDVPPRRTGRPWKPG